MGRDQEVEEEAGDDIGSSVVVTADADENAVLLEVDDHQSQVGDNCSRQPLGRLIGGSIGVLSTRTMRFLKPTKLVVSVDSWLRQVIRDSACVAKTWRYLLSLLRVRLCVEPLVCFEALPLLFALPLLSIWGCRDLIGVSSCVSSPVEEACVRVAMVADRRRLWATPSLYQWMLGGDLCVT